MPAKARKTTAKTAARRKPSTAGAKTSAKPSAFKGFNEIIILSPGAELTAAEAELRLRTVARHLKVPALPPVLRVAEIEANPNATALALYRAFRAVGRGGPALYLCAGNPTEGALSILQTDWGNTFLASNDGTLGLLASLFAQRGIAHTFTQLNTEAVLESEQRRMQNPDWQPAADFALRDLLAPAAAALLAGVPAARMGNLAATRTVATGLALHQTTFATRLQPLPLRLDEPADVHAVAIAPGNYLINLTLDPLSFDQLLDDRARFTLSYPGHCPMGIIPLTRRLKLDVAGPDGHTTGSCATGHCTPRSSHACHHGAAGHGCGNHLHLSPYPAPAWDERFLSLHITGCCVPALDTLKLTLTRTR